MLVAMAAEEQADTERPPSDEASAPEPVSTPLPEPAPPLESESRPLELPWSMFVKGGTTTSVHDAYMAAQEADARERRRVDDQEKAIARERGLAAGNPYEIATIYENQFTPHPEISVAHVPLFYMSRTGKEVEFVGQGDIVLVENPAFQDELALILFCPRCKQRLPAAHSIVTVRQSNRRWELDQRTAGEACVDPDGEFYRSAGRVMGDEKFTCPRCSWRAIVSDNKVWSE